MKMQNSREKLYFQGKNKNISLKDKKFCKVIDPCHYARKYRDATHSICNLKYSVPEKNS